MKEDRRCVICGAAFILSTRPDQVACSKKCWKEHNFRQQGMKYARTCQFCGKEFAPRYRYNHPKCCSKRCSSSLMAVQKGQAQVGERACEMCGIVFTLRISRKAQKRFCGKECADKAKVNPNKRRHSPKGSLEHRARITESLLRYWHSSESSILRKKLSRRMEANNPAADPVIVAKIRETKEANGNLHVWKGHRGGNGQITPQQQKVWEMLGGEEAGWSMDMAIRTGYFSGGGPRFPTDRGDGYPNNYKVDVGHRGLKVGIEVDGKGHRQKSAILKDRKKTECLEGLGWCVLRFTNEDVMTRPSWVLSQIVTVFVGM